MIAGRFTDDRQSQRDIVMLRYVGIQKEFGPRVEDNGVSFRLWAPKHNEVSLVLGDDDLIPMARTGNGWHQIVCDVVIPICVTINT
jgi:1,4-alpha-glucan branching enzyme